MNVHSTRELALEIAERIATLGPISIVRFFSGAGLTAQGVLFGFVIRGTLYLRVDDASRPAFEARGAAPFSYTTRVKTVTVAAYYEAPVDLLEDDDELGRWAAEAFRAAAAAPSRAAKQKRATVQKSAEPKTLTPKAAGSNTAASKPAKTKLAKTKLAKSNPAKRKLTKSKPVK